MLSSSSLSLSLSTVRGLPVCAPQWTNGWNTAIRARQPDNNSDVTLWVLHGGTSFDESKDRNASQPWELQFSVSLSQKDFCSNGRRPYRMETCLRGFSIQRKYLTARRRIRMEFARCLAIPTTSAKQQSNPRDYTEQWYTVFDIQRFIAFYNVVIAGIYLLQQSVGYGVSTNYAWYFACKM